MYGAMKFSYFENDYKFSVGEREQTDIELLKRIIPSCVEVVKTDKETDKKGIDYIVKLKGGATINIDAKTRRVVDIRDGDVLLAIETWSVMPDANNVGKIGWTFNDNTDVDYILYTFPREQWDACYLLPFQLLRQVVIENKDRWIKDYEPREQKTEHYGKIYYSQCLFIPSKEIRSLIYAKTQIKN